MGEAEDLLRRCQRGDDEALSELVRRYHQRIFRLAHRVVSDEALAEEAAAATLVKIWSKVRQWRGQSSAEAWIDRITIRTVLDVRRSQWRWWRRRTGLSPATKVDPRPGPMEAVLESEARQIDAQRVQRAVSALGEEDRVLVHLYYFEEKHLADIAAALGVSRETVKTRLARARHRLRTLLGPEA